MKMPDGETEGLRRPGLVGCCWSAHSPQQAVEVETLRREWWFNRGGCCRKPSWKRLDSQSPRDGNRPGRYKLILAITIVLIDSTIHETTRPCLEDDWLPSPYGIYIRCIRLYRSSRFFPRRGLLTGSFRPVLRRGDIRTETCYRLDSVKQLLLFLLEPISWTDPLAKR